MKTISIILEYQTKCIILHSSFYSIRYELYVTFKKVLIDSITEPHDLTELAITRIYC